MWILPEDAVRGPLGATGATDRAHQLAYLAEDINYFIGRLQPVPELPPAERSGDPVWPIVAEYHRVLIRLHSGAYASGTRVIDRALGFTGLVPLLKIVVVQRHGPSAATFGDVSGSVSRHAAAGPAGTTA